MFADNCQFLQEMRSLKAQLAAMQDVQAMTAGQQPTKSPLRSPFGSPITRSNTALPIASSAEVRTPTDTLPAGLASIPCLTSRGADACCCSSWVGTLLGTFNLANCVIIQLCQLAAIHEPSLAGLLPVDMQLAPHAFVTVVYECLGAQMQHVEVLLMSWPPVPAWD